MQFPLPFPNRLKMLNSGPMRHFAANGPRCFHNCTLWRKHEQRCWNRKGEQSRGMPDTGEPGVIETRATWEARQQEPSVHLEERRKHWDASAKPTPYPTAGPHGTARGGAGREAWGRAGPGGAGGGRQRAPPAARRVPRTGGGGAGRGRARPAAGHPGGAGRLPAWLADRSPPAAQLRP